MKLILLSILLILDQVSLKTLSFCESSYYNSNDKWTPPWYNSDEISTIECQSDTGSCTVTNFAVVPISLRYDIDRIQPLWTHGTCWNNVDQQPGYRKISKCIDEHLSYAVSKLNDWKQIIRQEDMTPKDNLLYAEPLNSNIDNSIVVFVTRDTTQNLFHSLAYFFAAYDSLMREGLDPRQLANRNKIQIVLTDNHPVHDATGLYHQLWETLTTQPVLYIDEWSEYNENVFPENLDFDLSSFPHQSVPVFIKRAIFTPKTMNCSPFWHFFDLSDSALSQEDRRRLLTHMKEWTEYLVGESRQTSLSRKFSYSQETVRLLNYYKAFRHFNQKEKLPELLIIQRLANSAGSVKGRIGRTVINEDEIVDVLYEEFGQVLRIRVIDFARLPIFEQIELVSQTDILMGVHGAGLAHLLFTPKHAVTIEIRPSRLPVSNDIHGGEMFKHLSHLMEKKYIYWKNDDKVKGNYPAQQLDGRMDDLWLDPNKIVKLVRKALSML